MIRSPRRAKELASGTQPANGGSGGRPTASLMQLNQAMASNGGGPQQGLNTDRPLAKPAGQLQLTDTQLDEEITRILNANNPDAPQNISRYSHREHAYKTLPNMEHNILHYEYDGYLVYKGPSAGKSAETATSATAATTGGDDAVAGQAATGTSSAATTSAEPDLADLAKKPSTVVRNPFNYSERAAQTLLVQLRDRQTNTDPPPHKTFCASVTQWEIYDAYTEDLANKERLKERSKARKDESVSSSLANLNYTQAHGGVGGDGTAATHEDYRASAEIKSAVTVLERMCNQNTYDEVTQDFKYWEDAADEFRDGHGVLLPLWKFEFEKESRKQVTAVAWNHQRPDLFAVGYGSYDFAKQGPGVLALFSLKNPTYPDFLYRLESGVMCAAFNGARASLLAAGLYDGSVLVFDLAKKQDGPVYRSARKIQHSDPVWELCWQPDDLDDNANFVSVSTDGRVELWTLLKTDLGHANLITLTSNSSSKSAVKSAVAGEDTAVVNPATAADVPAVFQNIGVTCCDFQPGNSDIFIVGTDSGKIFKCSRAYHTGYLSAYEGHHMSIYAVKFSRFFPSVFISCGADWAVHLWHEDSPAPILTFDVGASVSDVQLHPTSSSIFACATSDGKVLVYDLNESRYEPICDQFVTKKARLSRITFHPTEPLILVGDERGVVSSFKVSPNLRRLNRAGASADDTQADKLKRIVMTSMGRADEVAV